MATRKEIHSFCERLEAAWSNVPDLRFGQIMSIVWKKARQMGRDPFCMTNEELLRLYEDFDRWCASS